MKIAQFTHSNTIIKFGGYFSRDRGENEEKK